MDLSIEELSQAIDLATHSDKLNYKLAAKIIEGTSLDNLFFCKIIVASFIRSLSKYECPTVNCILKNDFFTIEVDLILLKRLNVKIIIGQKSIDIYQLASEENSNIIFFNTKCYAHLGEFSTFKRLLLEKIAWAFFRIPKNKIPL